MNGPAGGLGRRRAGTVLAFLIAIVVAIGCAFGLATHLRGHAAPDATGGVAGHAAAVRTTSPSGASGEATSWVSLAGVRLPVSPTAGPHSLAGGRAAGFARTPTGAAYAALHLSLRITPQAGPDIFEPTFTRQVIGGGAATLQVAVRAAYEALRQATGAPYGRPAGTVSATALGYRVDAFANADAQVRLLMRSTDADGSTALTTCAIQLRWLHGDWVLLAPPNGDWATMLARADSAAGFTDFPAG